MIYEISDSLKNELNTEASFVLGWVDNSKNYVNDLDFAHYLKAGFDIVDYLNTTYGQTISQLSIATPVYKLHRYNDHFEDIKQIDFQTGLGVDLKSVYEYDKGEPVTCTYYADAVMDVNGTVTYSDPIVLETFTWNRDAVGLCYLEETIIQWYYEDETLGPDDKITQHFLTPLEIIEEGKTRRYRIINGFQLPILKFIMLTQPRLPIDEVEGQSETEWDTNKEVRLIQMGRAFLAIHKMAFNNFGDDSHKGILSDIISAPDTWLDSNIEAYTGVSGLTIRLYLLDQLDVGTK